MAMIAVRTQTESRTRIAVSPQASAPVIPSWKLLGTQLSYALADPGAIIGAGLLVSLLLARWLPAPEYGAFALAFAMLVFLSGLHNALVLEPMSLLGPANYQSSLADYFEAQIWVHLATAGALAVPLLFAAGLLAVFGFGGSLRSALLGAGLVLPFILLFWLARRMACILDRPNTAMSAGAASLVLLIGGLLALRATHKATPFTAFVLLGVAGLCGALIIFYKLQVGLDESRPCSVSWRSAAEENWRFGCWQLGGAVCLASLGLTPLLLAPLFLGLGAAGKLFAMQIPALLILQCVAAATALLLPRFALDAFADSDEHLRQLAHRTSLSLAGASLLFAGLLYFAAAPLERLVFGGKYASEAWLMPLFMGAPLFAGLASGYSMALRAMQRPQFERLAARIAAAVSVQTAFLFIPLWGLAGAAISLVSGLAVHAAVVYLCFRHCAAEERETLASPQEQEAASFDHVNA